jgi:hypothetical protein
MRCEYGLELLSWQTRGQNGQGMTQIDHLIEAGSEKIVGLHAVTQQNLSGFACYASDFCEFL